jgi:hypothetical protein
MKLVTLDELHKMKGWKGWAPDPVGLRRLRCFGRHQLGERGFLSALPTRYAPTRATLGLTAR